MISNAANIKEIDLDSLFDDPKSMISELQTSDFSVQVQDINKVLNDALAQIDENHRITLETDDQFNEIYLPNNNFPTITDHENDAREEGTNKDIDLLALKPLSPISLLSDNSQINSPKEPLIELHLPPQSNIVSTEVSTETKSTESTQQLKRTFSDIDFKSKYEELLAANKKLKVENTDLTNAFENKTRILTRSIEELKRSEIERIQLMKENRELKQVVQKFVLNDF